MDEKTRQAYREAFALKEAGAKWSTIIEKLQEHGHVNSKGQPFAESTLRKEYSTLKKDPEKWRAVMGGRSLGEHAECLERETPERRTKEEPTSSNWEERLREIAEEVCQAMLENVRNDLKELVSVPHVPNVQNDMEVPPKPISTGRKQNRVYGKLGATTDGVLMDLFNAEAEKRGGSGRLMDIILWERYGRPMLSYQMDEGPRLDDLRARYNKDRKKREDA